MSPPDHRDLLVLPLDRLPDPLPLPTCHAPFHTIVHPPGSKSLTNRALLLATLATGTSALRRPLIDAIDARVMIEAVRSLGARVDMSPTEGGDTLCVTGTGGRLRGEVRLVLENAGTATRFLTAAACLADAAVEIDGSPRMRERPIGELIAMLRSIGVRIDELGAAGAVPLKIYPIRDGQTSDRIEVGPTQSSQFVSALLMIAPFLPFGLELRFTGAATSPSYIEMTVGLMKRVFGARVQGSINEGAIRVEPGPMCAAECTIEADASGATYFWAAAAVTPGASVRVLGIPGSDSLQADHAFADLLAQMGAVVTRERDSVSVRGTGEVRPIEADLSLMPDTAMTLAAVACFADGPSILHGLRTLRVKETDRLAALHNELTKIGATADVFSNNGDESLRIVPPPCGVRGSGRTTPVVFDTYDDHRMAMALSIITLHRPGVVMRDPKCVGKTYPTFWKDWALLFEHRDEG